MTGRREKLTAVVRLLFGIGILALGLVFLRACFSPPQLPDTRFSASPGAPPETSDALPSRY